MPLNINQNQKGHVARIRTGSHILELQMEALRNEYERFANNEGDADDFAAVLESARMVIQSTAAQWAALRTALGL